MFNVERKNLISVIICVYNYRYPQNLRAVLKSIQNQNIDVEIIISEQGNSEESLYKTIANEYNAKYVVSRPDYINGNEMYNIGRVRNIGAIMSTGKYLYFNDADIVIFNKKFFQTILEKSIDEDHYNWYRPSMYRLSEDTSGGFIEDYLADKSFNEFDLHEICLVDYDKTLGSIKPILGGECNETIISQPFVCTRKEFNIINSVGFNIDKADELIWKARFHYGGTFCTFDNFLNVAGYCELFYNYGSEDGDFHYKLRLKSGIRQMDSIVTKKSLIHFEHSRKYNNETFLENDRISENRRANSIDEMIKSDINNEKSFIGNYIRDNKNALESFIMDA